MIRLQIIFDFLSDSLFRRRLFFSRNIREVSAYIFVIKSSCVNADELEMLFFLSLRFPNLNYKRDEIFEFSIKIYVNAN